MSTDPAELSNTNLLARWIARSWQYVSIGTRNEGCLPYLLSVTGTVVVKGSRNGCRCRRLGSDVGRCGGRHARTAPPTPEDSLARRYAT